MQINLITFTRSPFQQTTRQIKHPSTLSPANPPVVTKQIMVHFQYPQEAWNQLSS